MRTSLTVFAKEVIDNFRDRRTLASALIMGPLFGPMLFAFVINLSIERSLDDIDRSLQVPVIGQQHAPNLVDYLGSHNIDVIEGPGSREAAMRAVTSGEHDVVVIIPDAFGQQLGDVFHDAQALPVTRDRFVQPVAALEHAARCITTTVRPAWRLGR